MKHILFSLAAAVAILAFANFSRAQVVSGMTSADRQYRDPGAPIYELGFEHRGVSIELRMHTWGVSAPGFSVVVWNHDPAAPEYFDVVAAEGSVTIDGQVADFVPFPATAEHPWGGRRAIIMPSWSTWPALPFTGRDVSFELYDPLVPSSRIGGLAENVTG